MTSQTHKAAEAIYSTIDNVESYTKRKHARRKKSREVG